MKINLLALTLLIFQLSASAQFSRNHTPYRPDSTMPQGLEQVLVEKFYVSNAADSVGSVGVLPVGSVTYRIYADLLPGYKFEIVYGSSTHLLRIASTAPFFNNEDRGDETPNGITVTNSKKNTVILDSWLSAGAAAAGRLGVLKKDDTDGSIVSTSTVLQNMDTSAGVPLKLADGMMPGSPCTVTILGLDLQTALDSFLNATSQKGQLISTTDGAWSCLTGASGADSVTNRVLVGQFTTKGRFSFKLNMSIGTPSGGIQEYVADSAVGTEIQLPSLTYLSPSSNVGINDLSETPANLFLYPNPASETVTLAISTFHPSVPVSYQLTDITGKIFRSADLGAVSGDRLVRLDVSSLSAGMYFIRCLLEGKSTSLKFIKN